MCLSFLPHCFVYATAQNDDVDELVAGVLEAIEPAVSTPPKELFCFGAYAIEPAVSCFVLYFDAGSLAGKLPASGTCAAAAGASQNGL